MQPPAIGSIKFNFYEEKLKQEIKERYYSLVTEFGFSEEDYIENIEIFIATTFPIILDEGYLPPDQFKKFCGLFMIPYSKIADEYYLFTLGDYAKVIYDERKASHFNQKELAQEARISPVDVYKFESYLKYPNRNQYIKLKKALII